MGFRENKNWTLKIIFALHSKKMKITIDILLEIRKNQKLEEFELIPVLEQLKTENNITLNDEITLTENGKNVAEQIVKDQFRDGFNKTLIRWDNSSNYKKMCEKIYGIYLGNLNMMTMNQLEILISDIQISNDMDCLDLGCGIGRITEYLSDKTSANFKGIDLANLAMEAANLRTREKRNRLSYEAGDLDHLKLQENLYDRIIAIDSLYFAYDLENLVKNIHKALKANGKAGLFYSQTISQNSPKDELLPDNTKLGKILENLNYEYRTIEFTEDEKNLWKRKLEIVEEMKEDFTSANEEDIYQSRIKETTQQLKISDDNRLARYLYIIEK